VVTVSAVSRYSRFRREREKDSWLVENDEDENDDEDQGVQEKMPMLQTFLMKEFGKDKAV